jgi:signal transduction histidine kinase
LLDAYELGRKALGAGLGVLDMAHVFSRVLRSVGPELSTGASDIERFFIEALSPFEIAHRGFRDANAALRRMNDMLEAQSRRIANALHDEASQMLTPLHLGLSDAARKAPPDVATDIESMRNLLLVIEERLRTLSHELRPSILDDLGLVPALELLATGMSKRWGLHVHVSASLDPPLPATVETTLYRVAHEALTNVVRHSGASEATVSIVRGPRTVACVIADNGKGIDPSASDDHTGGIGLAAIRERVGALGGLCRVLPTDGGGTSVRADIPLAES